MVNMLMHSTVGTTNRITDQVTFPAMLTKTTFVIFIKFKFTNFPNNFRYNTNFSGTDKTQTKNTDPRHKLFKNKSQGGQTCQLHNLNHRYFKINHRFKHPKKFGYRFTDFGITGNPFLSKNIPGLVRKCWKKKQKNEYEQSSGYWQHPSGSQNDQKNNTIFHDTGNNNADQKHDELVLSNVNFVFPTRNDVMQYICSIYSINFISSFFPQPFRKTILEKTNKAFYHIPTNLRRAFRGTTNNGIIGRTRPK